mgnify:CR=1 FL=1
MTSLLPVFLAAAMAFPAIAAQQVAGNLPAQSPRSIAENNPALTDEVRGDIMMARKMYRDAIDFYKPGAAKNKDTLVLGEKIWRGGIAAKGVPACAGCHSPNGAGIPAQYPRLEIGRAHV